MTEDMPRAFGLARLFALAPPLHADAQTPAATPMALDFAIAHWHLLRSLIEPTSQPAYVPDLLGNAWDLRLIDKLNAFAEHQIPPNARQDVVKSEAHIRYYAAIRSDRLPEVDRWLKAR